MALAACVFASHTTNGSPFGGCVSVGWYAHPLVALVTLTASKLPFRVGSIGPEAYTTISGFLVTIIDGSDRATTLIAVGVTASVAVGVVIRAPCAGACQRTVGVCPVGCGELFGLRDIPYKPNGHQKHQMQEWLMQLACLGAFFLVLSLLDHAAWARHVTMARITRR